MHYSQPFDKTLTQDQRTQIVEAREGFSPLKQALDEHFEYEDHFSGCVAGLEDAITEGELDPKWTEQVILARHGLGLIYSLFVAIAEEHGGEGYVD